ncbi:meiotic recombination protein SPO11-like [Homarus americanus]|uniref:meiotic recombination protein SPO11-like n=1 Tax=Homarus americanus TaxID=6706 RepID=UPI001C483F79|nr:meiotic recombination protein SPO11-like [Homarus americanus]
MAVNEEFWCEIEKLRMIILREGEEYNQTAMAMMNWEDISREMLGGCERIVEDVVASISVGEPPVLRVPRPPRSDKSGSGGESLVSLGAPRSTRRFTHLLHTLAQAYRLVTSGTYATRRDVYYESVGLYQTQASMDRSAEDLTRLLGVPRESLHLTITGKGLVAGALTYTTYSGTIVNVCQSQKGLLVPDSVEGLTGVVSDARYILVVEKDATFQKLVEAQVHRTYGPAILITGKGYPDISTRQLVHRLWRELKVPVLALTDADPYGLHIAAIYKFGALPSDLRALQLPAHALLPLSPKDHGKLASLAAHPSLSTNPSWLRQIEEQRECGYKAEIQSLTHISPDYLTSIYLPSKLRQGGWIL